MNPVFKVLFVLMLVMLCGFICPDNGKIDQDTLPPEPKRMRKNEKAEKPSPDGAMPFLAHLEELRWRLIKSLLSVLAAGGAIYSLREKIFEKVLTYPIHQLDPKPQLIFSNPSEAFIASIKIAFFGGVFVASPFVIYQAWRFVAPGLFKRERRYAFAMVILSVLSFAAGIAFSLLVTPHTIRFLVAFRTPSLEPFFNVNAYLSFVLKLTLAFGFVFQMPAASLILTRAGLITYKSLLGFWRVALIVVFVMAALITPPDVISQSMMAVPLLLLYLISVGVSRIAAPKGSL